MSTIHSLSTEIITRIAAGEVIERPAYAIKELIENALDAGATRIRIELANAGIDHICVEDDGCGMSVEDLQLAWKLHTTSKITSIDDLYAVQTKGFRGEALASIASVANLTIQSRTENEAIGHEICIENQKMIQSRTIGRARGTRVIVDSIFRAIPARQKFLRSPATELRHIIAIVTSFAIAYPTIRFLVRNGKKAILDLTTVRTMRDRLEQLVDETLTESLLPLKIQESYVTIDGLLTHPSQASSIPHFQEIFVNRRPVSDRMISQTVRDTLLELLPRGVSTSFVLAITVPAELVDVNIHPRKENVSFVSPETVQSALRAAIMTVITQHDLTFSASLSDSKTRGKITSTLAGVYLKQSVQKSEEVPPLEFTQFLQTYMLAEVNDGILMIDQHAAEERILYEQCKAEYLSQSKQNKKICVPPLQIALSQTQALTIKEHLDDLSMLGFSLTITSEKKPRLHIMAIPAILADRDPLAIILEVLNDLANGNTIRTVDTLTHKLLTIVACRSAVKAGDPLSPAQMLTIYETLQATENKYSCPHGRPTMIEIPKKDIEKMFGRR